MLVILCRILKIYPGLLILLIPRHSFFTLTMLHIRIYFKLLKYNVGLSQHSKSILFFSKSGQFLSYNYLYVINHNYVEKIVSTVNLNR